jgi:hypothetical protein
MPTSDLSTDASAEEERPNDIVIRPEDSASRRQLPLDPALLSPPTRRQCVDNVTSAVSLSFTDMSTGLAKADGLGVTSRKTEKSTLAKIGNFGGNAEDVAASSTILFVTNTCLDPSARTTPRYSDSSTKNAILHLRRVHQLGPGGDCNRQASASKAFGGHSGMLLHELHSIRINFEGHSFTLGDYLQYSFQRGGEYYLPLLVTWPLVYVLLFFSIRYVYSPVVQTAPLHCYSPMALLRQHNPIVDPRYVLEVSNTRSKHNNWTDCTMRSYILVALELA